MLKKPRQCPLNKHTRVFKYINENAHEHVTAVENRHTQPSHSRDLFIHLNCDLLHCNHDNHVIRSVVVLLLLLLWSVRWTVVTEMSACRSAAGVTVFDGRIFVSGGHDGLQIFNTVCLDGVNVLIQTDSAAAILQYLHHSTSVMLTHPTVCHYYVPKAAICRGALYIVGREPTPSPISDQGGVVQV